MRYILFCMCFLLIGVSLSAQTGDFVDVCPATGIQQRTPDFQPGGVILTTFDKADMWAYEIDTGRRYPLPDTAPCGTNCHLSPDGTWITYLNMNARNFGKMRLNGYERTLLVEGATEVSWWSDDTLLVWTANHEAFLTQEGSEERDYLNVQGVISIQPGGRWGLKLEQQDEDFLRVLVNTDTTDLSWVTEQGRYELGIDRPYFDAAAWSPDGTWLAYVAPTVYDANVGVDGAEVFAIRPEDGEIVQLTDLNSAYGAARVNGHAPGELSWSPDGTKIAFWVIEMTGSDPASDLGVAVIHMLDMNTQEVSVYCGFATVEHTPNPPRLIWSPDSTHVAFGGNVPGDDKGYLLLALNMETGVFTELSEGVYPALGNADVIAWGVLP